MNVLVTGGAGFIGSHIVDRLVADGHTVTVLDNLSTGRREHIPLVADFIQFDVTDTYLTHKLAGRRFDAVVHHAAQVSVPRSIADPEFDAQVNLVGTMNLAAYACQSGVRRFVFASSAAVYGNPRGIPVDERAPTDPLSPYAVSKLAAEEHLRQFECESNMQIVILRYANVYGPRQSTQGEPGVVCAMINQILAGQTLTIHGDGEQTRDFVYVADVAAANVLALKDATPGGVFNIGTGTSTSILELHDLLAGSDNVPQHTAPRPGDVRHSTLDSTAYRNRAGWQPGVSLREGLKWTWAYYLEYASTIGQRSPWASGQPRPQSIAGIPGSYP